MDSKKLEELVKKYWNCETSLEEEQQLREYFRGGNIPESWRETAALFRYFDEQKSKTTDSQFDETVLASIKKMPARKEGRVVKWVAASMRIAAGVAVLLAAIYFVRQELRSDTAMASAEDTFEDPQQAFEETKKALLMISKGFGRAEQQAKKINMFNEAQEKVQTTESEL
ncbi:MAG: hypothetical protein KF845_15330 [Cyclobacteriaceae bacterium]|nr:hypothetical protein [Cyclobacteriaceae bacterium]